MVPVTLERDRVAQELHQKGEKSKGKGREKERSTTLNLRGKKKPRKSVHVEKIGNRKNWGQRVNWVLA